MTTENQNQPTVSEKSLLEMLAKIEQRANAENEALIERRSDEMIQSNIDRIALVKALRMSVSALRGCDVDERNIEIIARLLRAC